MATRFHERNRKTVFVLGAGASAAYGLPVGVKLRSDVIGATRENSLFAKSVVGQEYFSTERLLEFNESFENSGMASIDAFLARRPEFSALGKHAIAYVLLNHESSARLAPDTVAGDWYGYFWRQLSPNSWDELDFSRYSFVTFNYDRTFEVYLLRAMMGTYGKDYEVCRERFSQLEILHVYGDLGALPETFTEFKSVFSTDKDKNQASFCASQGINVIPEGRDDAKQFQRAQELIKAADNVVFLGFGFDQLNVHRLQCPRVLSQTDEERENWPKLVLCTARGMNHRDLENVVRVTGVPVDATVRIAGASVRQLYPSDCLDALRAWPAV